MNLEERNKVRLNAARVLASKRKEWEKLVAESLKNQIEVFLVRVNTELASTPAIPKPLIVLEDKDKLY